MKTALYMEDGLVQVVITPETDMEKRLLDLLHEGPAQFELKRGAFYECRGGWMRHKALPPYGHQTESDQSTMFVVRSAALGASDGGTA